MKLWLDDIREAPEGWEHVHTVQECIDYLSMGADIEAIDLDNDLGDCDTRQGYEVMDYIENRLAMLCQMPPKEIYIHTGNPSAAQRMKVTLDRIRKMEKALRIQQAQQEKKNGH